MHLVSLNEGRSEIGAYAGWDGAQFAALAHIPVTKASADFYTIADVMTNGASMAGELVNLLCAVGKVRL